MAFTELRELRENMKNNEIAVFLQLTLIIM